MNLPPPDHTITSITERHRSHIRTPLETIDDALSVISAQNLKLNALRVTNPDARSQAAALEKKISNDSPLGRLIGVPFSVKDHIDVSGIARSEGTLLGATDCCSETATIVQLLLDEDALCIGKGNMAEYGKSYFTDNKDFGRSTNPYDTDYTCGGSGGGDAAAVASRMAVFGIGADTGGSIRIPANFCGLFGLYPTPGLFSTAGFTSYSHTVKVLFRSPGIFTRSLDDLELLTRILARYDAADPESRGMPLQHRTGINPVGSNARSFGWFDTLNGAAAHSAIRADLQKSVQRFEKSGYQSVQISPVLFEQCYEVFILLAGQASLILEDFLAETSGTPRKPELESPSTATLRRRIANELPPLTVESLLSVWHAVHALRNKTVELFENLDFILSPVTATPVPEHETSEFQIDGQKLESQEVFQFSSSTNVLGLPAIAFPTGLDEKTLPLGLQVIGPRFSEFKLLSALKAAGYTNCLEL